MSVWNQSILKAALAQAGLEQGKDGTWLIPGSGHHGWALRTHPAGFISFSRPFSVTKR